MLDWKECVQQMIDFVEGNLRGELSLRSIADQVGYSPFYCSKAFRMQMGLCLKDYIRLRRISASALELRDTKKRIIDIALEYGYSSQEAFTRSFMDEFSVTPAAYRRKAMPIPLFIRSNITHQHREKGEDVIMDEKILADVKVSFLKMPARKMLVWYKEGATDYHELCAKEGAERVWGLLESFKGTLGGPIAAWLNSGDNIRYVWAVEVPVDYDGSVPEKLETIMAPECDYVRFCHPPYPEEMHEAVTEAVWNVSEQWRPQEHGLQWHDRENPVYENDRPDEGYVVLKPVKSL